VQSRNHVPRGDPLCAVEAMHMEMERTDVLEHMQALIEIRF